MGIIIATALPSVISSVASYSLHGDASNLGGTLNVARMRAASQYAPYRVNVVTSSATYSLEQLCGNTSSTVDSNCTSAYKAFTTPSIESGTQYAQRGNSFASCRPSGVTSYPGTITADPTGCPGTLQLYFNTRGAAVDQSGNPLANGGAVVYLTNQKGLVDAVTVSVGGQVAVWNWNPGSASWSAR